MESRYALRRDLHRERVILITGMCLVLAAQQERRRQRERYLLLLLNYALFALSLSRMAAAMDRGIYWLAAEWLIAAFLCARAVATPAE